MEKPVFPYHARRPLSGFQSTTSFKTQGECQRCCDRLNRDLDDGDEYVPCISLDNKRPGWAIAKPATTDKPETEGDE